MKNFICLIFVLFVSSNAVASKPDKIRTLMEAQGILERFTQVQEKARAKSRQEAMQLVEQMEAELLPASEEVRASITAAHKVFLEKYLTPMDPEEMVEVYSKFYGEKFTEEELDKLI